VKEQTADPPEDRDGDTSAPAEPSLLAQPVEAYRVIESDKHPTTPRRLE
jgi:hypothetical protein